jgi:tryptophan synthase beta chain
MPTEFVLTPEEMPRQWYNIVPDLPEPLPPPQDPEGGGKRLEFLGKVMIKECLKQDVIPDRWVNIPDGILELYYQAGRPRQLFRAKRLEEYLKTPARLYYKAEFYSPTGSHKVNTALAQAYYAAKQGLERLTTETGAGQWGTALSYAACLADLECTVYWVRAVHNWKPQRKAFMNMFGAKVFASPSHNTEAGRNLLKEDPNHLGSLGIAISEGLEDASHDPESAYALGSCLNHVLMHQTIIGLEAKKQFEKAGDYPDVVISCLGGGSNFGGFAIPFYHDVLKKNKKIKFLAAQSESAPNLQGEYRYDYADHAELAPQMKMYTLGHHVKMVPIKGDGLRYHAASPILSLLRHRGMLDTVAYPPDEKYVFEKTKLFVQKEGFLPAPESAYSVCAAIDEALACKEKNEEKVIAFNISGHGLLDLDGYQEVLKF